MSESNITKNAGKTGLAVLLSRITGLFREQVFVGLFGVGLMTDAFTVAFKIPNLLRELLSEGALANSLITVFSKVEVKEGKEKAYKFLSNVQTVMFVFVSALVVLGIIFSEELVRLLVNENFEAIEEKFRLTVFMTQLMFPFLLCMSGAAIIMGALNVKGSFFLPNIASALFNIASICFAFGLYDYLKGSGQYPIIGLAIGTIAGGLLQWGMQAFVIKSKGYKFTPTINFKDKNLRLFFAIFLPTIIGAAAPQLNAIINLMFASSLPQGNLTYLNNAFRLTLFPLAIFGVAVAIAGSPEIAKKAAEDKLDELKGIIAKALTVSLFMIFPIMLFTIIFREETVKVIFEHGRYTSSDTSQTASALLFYAMCLPAYASIKIVVPAFYALKKTPWAVVGSFVSVLVNLIFCNLLIGPMGLKGLALASTLSITTQIIFQIIMLRIFLGSLFRIETILKWFKIFAAAAGAAIIMYFIQRFFADSFGKDFVSSAITLIVGAGISFSFYFGFLYLLKTEEALALITNLKRKIAPKK